MNSTERDAILSLPDDGYVCHAFIADLICSKNWDSYIDQAFKKHGDDITCVPMWVEPRGIEAGMSGVIGKAAEEESKSFLPITADKIWNNWRKLVCHALSIPSPTDNDFISEEYFDDYISISNSKPMGDDGIIIEGCGDRIYGYWAPLISKNHRFKKVIRENDLDIGPGWDLDFESLLGTKAVITKSFVLHSHFRVILDDKFVEKYKE